jgi:hypothetical protein
MDSYIITQIGILCGSPIKERLIVFAENAHNHKSLCTLIDYLQELTDTNKKYGLIINDLLDDIDYYQRVKVSIIVRDELYRSIVLLDVSRVAKNHTTIDNDDLFTIA